MSFKQFAASRGYDRFAGDVATNRLPGASEGTKKRIVAAQLKVIQENGEAIDSLRAEYSDLIAIGKMREPTRIESLIETARGNSDNQSVQAARRVLERSGKKW